MDDAVSLKVKFCSHTYGMSGCPVQRLLTEHVLLIMTHSLPLLSELLQNPGMYNAPTEHLIWYSLSMDASSIYKICPRCIGSHTITNSDMKAYSRIKCFSTKSDNAYIDLLKKHH